MTGARKLQANVEAAIKLLQDNEYTVFRDEAIAKLRATQSVDSRYLAEVSQNPDQASDYKKYQREKMLRLLAGELDRCGLVKHEIDLPEQVSVGYGDITRTVFVSELELWPKERAEWRR